MGSGSKASAVTAIRRAAELAPDDPLAQRALCEMLARTGETAEARAAVERLLKTFPDQWETWSSAGHDLATYLDAPDWGCELSARATQLQPALPVTWRSYGATLCTAGRFDEGDAAYDRCWQLTTQPRHPGRTLEVAERFLPAQRDLLEKWLTRALTDAAAWMPICAGRAEYIRARALEGLGRSDAAAAAYRRALASDQLSDDHRRHAQDALRGLGDAAGASAPKRGRPKA